MRSIKFRYRFNNRVTNEIITQICTIQDIENRPFSPNLFGSLQFEVLSRDMWTGLLDKNGKEILEGDILKINSNYETDEPVESIAKVFFKDGAFQTDFHDALLRIGLKRGNWILEVIGNIYENPELLETTP